LKPGCLQFLAFQDAEDPERFALYFDVVMLGAGWVGTLRPCRGAQLGQDREDDLVVKAARAVGDVALMNQVVFARADTISSSAVRHPRAAGSLREGAARGVP
jgi:hypothetical protein